MVTRDELRGAVGVLTAWRPPAGLAREALAGGLAVYPLVGLALGGVAGALAAAVARVAPALAGPAAVAALAALSGLGPVRALAAVAGALGRPGDAATARARLRARPGGGGVAAALGVLGAKTWAVAVLPASVRPAALAGAAMLGAWAIVVQCHGGSPAHARGPAAALVGRARFREFGWASLVALGLPLVAADAVGLAVVLVAGATTMAVRLWTHRRLDAITGRVLLATRELVEAVVLATLALVAQLNR
jgi:cobalamin synthase